MTPQLEADDRAKLAGEHGAAVALAMRIVMRMAEVQQAPRLIDVTRAHIDGCLYHGRAGLDFAERLVAGGGRVGVPTTLNVSSLDLLHPDLYRGDPETARLARRLMACYEEMGCRPTWTCSPYQLPDRPGFGEHVAWAESNAVVFANSVLGARTDRYGDFIDICAALTGRVPDAGLHRPHNRRGEIVFSLDRLSDSLRRSPILYPLLGHLIGSMAGSRVPVVLGAPDDLGEDDLKALGAAAASSGSVGLVHVVGVTPEAPTLEAALQGGDPARWVEVSADDLHGAWDELNRGDGPLVAVSLGTPHASLDEIERVAETLKGRRVAIDTYLSTARHILAAAREGGLADLLEAAGVRFVTDTCTYITPIIDAPDGGTVMTDSAKWAYYAPGNLGVGVALGSLTECVESAVAGEVRRDDRLWS